MTSRSSNSTPSFMVRAGPRLRTRCCAISSAQSRVRRLGHGRTDRRKLGDLVTRAADGCVARSSDLGVVAAAGAEDIASATRPRAAVERQPRVAQGCSSRLGLAVSVRAKKPCPTAARMAAVARPIRGGSLADSSRLRRSSSATTDTTNTVRSNGDVLVHSLTSALSPSDSHAEMTRRDDLRARRSCARRQLQPQTERAQAGAGLDVCCSSGGLLALRRVAHGARPRPDGLLPPARSASSR